MSKQGQFEFAKAPTPRERLLMDLAALNSKTTMGESVRRKISSDPRAARSVMEAAGTVSPRSFSARSQGRYEDPPVWKQRKQKPPGWKGRDSQTARLGRMAGSTQSAYPDVKPFPPPRGRVAKSPGAAKRIMGVAGTTTPFDEGMSWAKSADGFYGSVLPDDYYDKTLKKQARKAALKKTRATAGKIAGKALGVGVKTLGLAGIGFTVADVADMTVDSGVFDDTLLGNAMGWSATDFEKEQNRRAFKDMMSESGFGEIGRAMMLRRTYEQKVNDADVIRSLANSRVGMARIQANNVLDSILGGQERDLLAGAMGRQPLSDEERMRRAGLL